MSASIDPGPRIGFRRDIAVEVVSGEAVYLHAEHHLAAARGPVIENLAPLLGGELRIGEVIAASGQSPVDVADALRHLDDEGLLTEREDVEVRVAPSELAYWEAAGLPATTAAARLRAGVIDFFDLTASSRPAPAAAVRKAMDGLDSVMTSVVEPSPDGDVSVVVTDDYLDPRLAELDAEHRLLGRPWLLARPGGATVWVGPWFEVTDPDAACYRCLADQISVQRPAGVHLRDRRGDAMLPPLTSLVPLADLAGAAIALETAKWLSGYRYDRQSAIWTLDSRTIDGRHHSVRRRPQCPACGDPGLVARRSQQAVRITSRTVARSAESRDRVEPPEATYARYEHLISPVTGLVPEVRPDVRAPDEFAVMRSGGNHALRTGNIAAICAGLRAENGGKGSTPAQARTSALCEATERHSATYAGDEAVRFARHRDLGAEAIHPDRVQLWAPHQHAGRAGWNRDHGPFQHVAAACHDDDVLAWTPVWSITGNCHRLLPTALLYLGAPPPISHPSLRADSNGTAAGATLEDAVLHGLLELIERDAVALWWYNRTPVPGVPLDPADPWLAGVAAAHRRLGREMWVLDVTSDFGIPVHVAISRRTGGAPEEIMFGFGAHLDPAQATRRAVAELNQLMPSLIGARTGAARGDVDTERWLAEGTLAANPYLAPTETGIRSGRPATRPAPSGDLGQDVDAVVDAIHGRGLEVLVADLTRPDIGLPVVKTVVPGLRGFWARFAPGRLFDIPVELGRRDRPAALDELNRYPMFL